MSNIIRCDKCGYEENYSCPKYTERRTFQERYEGVSITHICSRCVFKDAISSSNSAPKGAKTNSDYVSIHKLTNK
jgi:hypothetical protein